MGAPGTSGYTLIELTIAVAIMGIVAAVALPAWQSYVDTTNMARVNAAFENAVRVAGNTFAKSRARIAMGLPSGLPSGKSHWDRIGHWIELFDPDGVEAPGGGPAYVDTRTSAEEAARTGAIRINFSPASGALTVHRPAYRDLSRATAAVTADSMEVRRADD